MESFWWKDVVVCECFYSRMSNYKLSTLRHSVDKRKHKYIFNPKLNQIPQGFTVAVSCLRFIGRTKKKQGTGFLWTLSCIFNPLIEIAVCCIFVFHFLTLFFSMMLAHLKDQSVIFCADKNEQQKPTRNLCKAKSLPKSIDSLPHWVKVQLFVDVLFIKSAENNHVLRPFTFSRLIQWAKRDLFTMYTVLAQIYYYYYYYYECCLKNEESAKKQIEKQWANWSTHTHTTKKGCRCCFVVWDGWKLCHG